MPSTLKERISDAVKQAMRAQEKKRLATLRFIQAAIKQKEIDERVELEDEGVLDILNRLAKQHRDSIQHFQQAERFDLADKEQLELNIVQEYLPAPLSEEALLEMIRKGIEETKASTLKEMGKVMGWLKPRTQGTDMGMVSKLLKQQLNH